MISFFMNGRYHSARKSKCSFLLALQILLLVIASAVGLQGFVSCDLAGTQSGETIVGTWKSAFQEELRLYYDNFSLKCTYSFITYDTNEKTIGFEGIVVNSPDLTSQSGYLILKITNGGSYQLENGKYYAIHWKNFIGDTMEASNAYKDGSSYNFGISSLDDAIKEYTVENGYYAFAYSEYQRQ